MDATLKRLEPRIRAGDYAEFIAIEHQFHSLFIDNCRNRLLRDLLDDLQDHLERVRRYYRDEVGLHKEQEFEEHRRIIDAMATHAPDTLEQAVREHVEGFTVRLLADLTQAEANLVRGPTSRTRVMTPYFPYRSTTPRPDAALACRIRPTAYSFFAAPA